MEYNILIGGAAGQGMKSLASIIGLSLKRHGYHIHEHTIYMSRIRGGHNYFQIRFADVKVESYKKKLDAIVALNQETIEKHQINLKEDGFIIGDEKLSHDKLLPVTAKMTAKALGHLKGENIVLLGAFVKAFSLDKRIFKDVIEKVFKSKALELNYQAFSAGYEIDIKSVDAIPTQEDEHLLINGNTSIALGAIAAGLRVFSAYPMTPSTSIMNYLLEQEKSLGYMVEQAEDEIAAIHIALGASYGGVRSMTASSGGGLALMVEAIGLTAITETPLVIVDVMRPGPATGMPTKTGQSDLSFLLHASQDEFPRMILAVRDPEDAYYQTIRAFDIADEYQMPVFVLNDQYLADAQMTIPMLKPTQSINQHLASSLEAPYKRYKITDTGISPRLIPGQFDQPIICDNHEHGEFGEITEDPSMRTTMHLKRLRKLETLKKHIQEPRYIGLPDAEIILVGFGSVQGAIAEYVKHNEHVGGLIFGDIYPLPTKKLKHFSHRTLINVEMNATGQLARLIRMETGITFKKSLLKFDGLQINDEIIEEVLHDINI